MAINFPNSPVNGDVYTEGNRSWTWNGVYWRATSVTLGYTGSRGYAGSIGYSGSAGDPGAGTIIKGSVASSSLLDPAYQGDIGDAYIASDTGHLWVWDGAQWYDVGQVAGYSGSLGYTGSRGALDAWTYITANTTANSNARYIADTTNGQFTVTLPANPTLGYYVVITDGGAWNDTPLLVDGNGETIEGYTDQIALDVTGITVEFIWNPDNWEVTATLGVRGDLGYTGSQGPAGEFAALGYTGSAAALGALDQSLIPDGDDVYDLGSADYKWRSLYVGANTIFIGTSSLSVDEENNQLVLTNAQGEPVEIGGASVEVSDTAPADPSDGNMWLDSTTGNFSVYVGGGWLKVGPGGGGSASVEVSGTAPSSPDDGNMWMNDETGEFSVYVGGGWLTIAGGGGGAGGGTSYDEPAESTGYFGLPVGTTAQRPGTPAAGMVRYNSTSGYAEVYTANGWGIFGALPPTISSVSPTGYLGSSGTQFDISGTNFTSDASVSFILSNGTVSAAGSFTYINSSLIQATTGQEYVEAQGPLDVRVSQASGIATVADAIAVGFSPTWVTAAGSLGDVYYEDDQAQAVSFTVEATDPEGTTVTYSTESTLPTALTLNSSTGVISGDLDPIVSPVVTNNFTVTATEGTGKTANRTFSIVRRWRDGSSSSQYGVTAAQIKSLTGTNDNGYYWLNLGNSQGPTEVYCIMDSSYDSGGWMMWYGNKVGTILSTQRISSDTLNVSSSTPMLDWYNLNYAMRSGITAISTQGKTLIGTHNNTAVQGWAILQRTGGATGYVWDSTSHTTGNFRFENLFTMTSSNGTTDASVDVGITNYTQSVGGDFGIAVDTLDHHDNSNYYMLNNSCASQYIYEHGFGYKATTALSGFNSTTTSCTQSNTNSFGFFIAQR